MTLDPYNPTRTGMTLVLDILINLIKGDTCYGNNVQVHSLVDLRSYWIL